MESLDRWCVGWLRKNRPDSIRGELSENVLKSDGDHPGIVRFIVTFCLENFWAMPDFIAYHFPDRNNVSVALCRKVWGVEGVSWTLRTREDFDRAVTEGWIPIFEGFRPEPRA